MHQMISISLLAVLLFAACDETTGAEELNREEESANPGWVPDTLWTYKQIGDKELQMSVFLRASTQ